MEQFVPGVTVRKRAQRIGMRWLSLLSVVLFVPGLLIGCGGSSGNEVAPEPTGTAVVVPPPTATSTPIEAPTEASEPTAIPSPTIAVDEDVSAAVSTLLDGQTGVFGIVITRPDGTVAYQENENTPFVMASLYKLVLLANIFEKRENGDLTFDQEVELLPEYFPEPGDFADSVYDESAKGSTARVEDLVFETGAFSSNVAAKALLSLTDNSSLDRTTIELGLADTYLFIDPATLPAWTSEPSPSVSSEDQEALTFVEDEASAGPVNITTPHDMNRYFQLLLDGQVINKDVSGEIMDILKQQMVDDRFPYLLPPGTEMAHKTGNLDHVVHDVGIIWTSDGPVILIAMVEDPPNDDIATQIIQRLALIADGERDIPAFTDQAVETVESTEETTTEPDEESAANG